jgi:hypothetical protein
MLGCQDSGRPGEETRYGRLSYAVRSSLVLDPAQNGWLLILVSIEQDADVCSRF